MKMASVLESWEPSGHTGTFPSRAEGSWDGLECSGVWAACCGQGGLCSAPSGKPSLQASSFPLGWSCTPAILCFILLLP